MTEEHTIQEPAPQMCLATMADQTRCRRIGVRACNLHPEGPYRDAVVGGYKLQRRLGRGGFGAVFLGNHETMDRKAAVKILLHARPRIVEMFVAEVRALVRVSHEGLPRVYHGEVDGSGVAYMAMEFLVGDTLDKVRKAAGGRLDWRRACQLVAQAADAIQALHDAGLAHLDVKPTNIIVRAGDRVSVIDLGCAYDFEVQADGGDLPPVSPRYLAPEYPEYRRDAAKVDVYLLGIVLYECIAGVLPFKPDQELHRDFVVQQYVELHRAGLGRRLGDVVDVPAAVDNLVAKMLSLRPADRPGMDEVLEVLQGPLEGGHTMTAERPPSEPPRNVGFTGRWWMVALVIIIGAGVFAATRADLSGPTRALDAGITDASAAEAPAEPVRYGGVSDKFLVYQGTAPPPRGAVEWCKPKREVTRFAITAREDLRRCAAAALAHPQDSGGDVELQVDGRKYEAIAVNPASWNNQ